MLKCYNIKVIFVNSSVSLLIIFGRLSWFKLCSSLTQVNLHKGSDTDLQSTSMTTKRSDQLTIIGSENEIIRSRVNLA